MLSFAHTACGHIITTVIVTGLPMPVDQMPAEEQLALLGINPSSLIPSSKDGALDEHRPPPPPQLYSAPDPEEDPQALRAMESLGNTTATNGYTVNHLYNAFLPHLHPIRIVLDLVPLLSLSLLTMPRC